MSMKEFENWIDKIVVDMEETLEKNGSSPKNVSFSYSQEEIVQMGFTEDQFKETINRCISLELIKKTIWARNESYCLTEEGRARARSCMLQQNEPAQSNGHSVFISGDSNTIQLGDITVQNINIVLKNIVERIESADASEKEKTEAKNLFQKFIEHPLVNTILGVAGGVTLS